MSAAAVAAALSGRVYHFSTEDQLQAALAAALTAAGLPARREVRLSEAERIDIMVGAVGVEVKTKGTAAQALRQLARYAGTGRVDELVLVSTRARHLTLHGKLAGGVPVTVVRPAWM